MTVSAEVDGRRAQEKLGAVLPAVKAGIGEAVVQLSVQLVQTARGIAAGMFSGDGKLEDRIVGGVTASPGRVTGWARTASDAATFLEAGYSGDEEVRAHARRVTEVFGRPVTAVDASVGQSARQVDYPAHSFLRTALEELAAPIQSTLQAAASEAAKKATK